jgi:hypothetical protein
MHEALITPPEFTSSTTFYTGITAGRGETARPSPTTPIAPARPGAGTSAKVGGRRYGQKGRESDSEESDSGWSSDATITKRKYRSPLVSCRPYIANYKLTPRHLASRPLPHPNPCRAERLIYNPINTPSHLTICPKANPGLRTPHIPHHSCSWARPTALLSHTTSPAGVVAPAPTRPCPCSASRAMET